MSSKKWTLGFRYGKNLKNVSFGSQHFRKRWILPAMAFLSLAGPVQNARAQPESPGDVPCNGNLYFTRQFGNGTGGNPYITRISSVTNSESGVNVENYNQLNPNTRTNATVYYNGYVFTQNWLATSTRFLRVKADGTYDESDEISGLPNNDFNNAGVDANGIMYILSNDNTVQLYKIDLKEWPDLTAESVNCGMKAARNNSRVWGDIAFDPITHKAYAWYHPSNAPINHVDSAQRGLYEIQNYNTGTPNIVKVGQTANYTMGTLFFNERGQLFSYGVTYGAGAQNNMYYIHLNNDADSLGLPRFLATSEQSDQSDGCECAYRLSLSLTAGENGIVEIPNCSAPGAFDFNLIAHNNADQGFSGITFNFPLDNRFTFADSEEEIKTSLESFFGEDIEVNITSIDEGTNNHLNINNISIPPGPTIISFDLSIAIAPDAVSDFTDMATVNFQSEFGGLSPYYGEDEPSSDPLDLFGKNESTITFDKIDDLCNSVSGTVFNDINGIEDGINDQAPLDEELNLYAVLVSDANVITAFQAIDPANGNYMFKGIPLGTYRIILTTNDEDALTSDAIGENVSTLAITPPAGWVYTGEQLGDASLDNPADGILNGITVSAAGSVIADADFGIQQPPVTDSNTLEPVSNPGGTNTYTLPSDIKTFDFEDFNGGTVTSITITQFPEDATSITVGDTTYYPTEDDIPEGCATTCVAFDPVNGITINITTGDLDKEVSVDPVDGPSVTVVIPFIATDNAGAQSNESALNIPFTSYSISGNVKNDPDAGNVDGDNIDNDLDPALGGDLIAVLVDADNKVYQVTDVLMTSGNEGTYTFPAVPNGDYSVILTSKPGTNPAAGSNAGDIVISLPEGWANAGEQLGVTTPDETDGILTGIEIDGSNVTDANFGIQQPPVTDSNTLEPVSNPGGTNTYTLPSDIKTFDFEDFNGGTVTSITITQFPEDATSITVGDTTYYPTEDDIPEGCATTCVAFDPVNGITINITTGDLDKEVSVDPVDGPSVTVVIPFIATDNAGAQSNESALNIPFTSYSISGNVKNDPDAGNVDGDNIDNDLDPALGGDLIAVLVDADNKVYQVTDVLMTSGNEGTYTFPAVPNGDYSVILTSKPGTNPAAGSNAGDIVISLPEGWANAGEQLGVTTPDETDGILTGIEIDGSNVTDANFGIQQPPVTDSNTLEPVSNPGGTNTYTLPSDIKTFDFEDFNGGTVTSITITQFPEDATSITVGDTTYYPTEDDIPEGCATTCVAFDPVNGITINITTGDLDKEVSVDPVDGPSVTVVIPFIATDNAGAQSNESALNIPFTSYSISGNVKNDPDAGNVDGDNIDNDLDPALGGDLIAVLVDADNKVYQVTDVLMTSGNEGTYTFPAVPNGDYSVILTSKPGTNPAVGSNAGDIVISLPEGWANAGEQLGVTTPDETDGILTGIEINGSNVTDANFGIQHLPETVVNTDVPRLAPAPGDSLVLDGSIFRNALESGDPSTSDYHGGEVTGIRFISFPENADTVSIGDTLYWEDNWPSEGVVTTFDPEDGITGVAVYPKTGAEKVELLIAAIDNAGFEDPSPGKITIPFENTYISGHIFNDPDGGNVNPITGIDNLVPAGLYALLLDDDDIVIAQTEVNTDGSYTLPVTYQDNYTVKISNGAATEGAEWTSDFVPPYGWAYMGAYTGNPDTDPGNTGDETGTSSVITMNTLAAQEDVNFAIQELPNTVVNIDEPRLAPAPGNSLILDGTIFINAYEDYDPSTGDGTVGAVVSIRFTDFPVGADSITINGSTYKLSTWPIEGISAPYNSTTGIEGVAVYPSAGAAKVELPISAIDNGGMGDPSPGKVTIPFAATSVNGNVFNDPNAADVDNSTGTDNAIPAGIYAALIDENGIVRSYTEVNTAGTYSIPVTYRGEYQVRISTSEPEIGDDWSGTIFGAPEEWSYTGTKIGVPGTGNTLDTTGTSESFVMEDLNEQNNVNFGIQELPETVVYHFPSQLAPATGEGITIPGTAFVAPEEGSTALPTGDESNGTVTHIRFTAFPEGAASVTIGDETYTSGTWPAEGVVADYNPITGISGVTVYPDLGVTGIVLPIAAIDNAGTEDLTAGSIHLPFATTTLSGNVFNDPDAGLVNNSTSGTNLIPSGTYAHLLNEAGIVMATTLVPSNGAYSFPLSNTGSYSVSLGNSAAEIGTEYTGSYIPPSGWTYTGSYIGEPNTGNDEDGIGKSTPVTVEDLIAVNNVNFGIQRLPQTVVNTMTPRLAPAHGGSITLPSSIFINATASGDPSTTDYSGGTVQQIRFVGFPSGIESVTINGTNYNLASWPEEGVTANYSSSTGLAGVQVYPQDGVAEVILPIAAIDNGNGEDPTPGSITVPFEKSIVQGSVFNDPDAGNVNNSSDGINTVPAGIFANLLDNDHNVISTVPVNGDGTYQLEVPYVGNYSVQLTNSIPVSGEELTETFTAPEGWSYTGAFTGIPNSGNTGDATGASTSFTVNNLTPKENVNFGIQELPETVVNLIYDDGDYPAGTAVLIPSSAFTSSITGTDPSTEDYSGGEVTTIRFTAFPTGADSIEINGTIYTSGTWPSEGVSSTYIPGNGVTGISVYPATGISNVIVPIASIDNAGTEDPTPGNVTLFLDAPLPVQLVSFGAYVRECTATVEWKTASEDGCEAMYLEISNDGLSFETLAAQQPKGDNSSYAYSTDQLENGIHFFRLRMKASSGQDLYSDIRRVSVACDSRAITIYPNPAQKYVFVRGLQIGEQVQLINVLGQKVSESVADHQDLAIDLELLPAGMYYLNIVSPQGARIREFKIVKE
ncbi:MAG: T9SS type A sorting domain-containing protein [Taibaiella sp.]|nr:T9SS type A sorting domain-containing protein [Taibaiella sp.]